MSASSTTASHVVRWAFALVIAAFIVAATLSALGVFKEPTPYRVIHHPTHNHYIPKDCGDDVQVSHFPMRRPGKNEHITCDGNIIRE